MKIKGRLAIIASLLAATGPMNVCAAADGALFQVAHLCAENDYQGALKLIEPLARGTGGSDPNAHLWYGRVLMNLKRVPEARAEFEKAIQLDAGAASSEARAALAEIREPEPVASSLAKGGRVGYLGILLNGPLVTRVVPGSPAAKAGLLVGDKVVTVDSRSTRAMKSDEVIKALHGLVGVKASLLIERNGRVYSCAVTRAQAVQTNDLDGPSLEFSARSDTKAAVVPPAAGTVAKNSSPVQADSIDTSLVSIQHKTADSTPIYEQVITALHLVPKELKKELADWGLKIVIVPNILEARPDMRTEKPRGYIHGGGYDNCGGLYMPSEKTVYITEKVSIGNDPYQRNVWISGTLVHEMGHAYDHFGTFSKSEQFVRCHDSDSRRMPNDLRTQLYYYTQNENGTSELFAELFKVCLGASDGAEDDSASMRAGFPETNHYMENLLTRVR